MSAVLSRRILGHLLRKYAGKKQFTLQEQIDSFTAEKGVRTTLEALRPPHYVARRRILDARVQRRSLVDL